LSGVLGCLFQAHVDLQGKIKGQHCHDPPAYPTRSTHVKDEPAMLHPRYGHYRHMAQMHILQPTRGG
jgi:hypothetical protein